MVPEYISENILKIKLVYQKYQNDFGLGFGSGLCQVCVGFVSNLCRVWVRFVSGSGRVQVKLTEVELEPFQSHKPKKFEILYQCGIHHHQE